MRRTTYSVARPVQGRFRPITLCAFLGAVNVIVWLWAWSAFADHPVLLGTAFLAWVFGLRHAVDADHIAAIDNVVRKLIQEGQRPVTAGFFFSLGHSTVVVAASAAVAATSAALHQQFEGFRAIGGVIGTAVSASFLFAIAMINLFILRGVWRSFRQVRRGGALDAKAFDTLLAGSGLLARLARPLFAAVRRTWHMYPLGFLFGLGFDTATEIALLVLAGGAVAGGLPFYAILCLPVLFAAGMCLLDTIDGSFMNFAYGWAFSRPVRKVYYNLVITGLSVAVALFIGTFELLSILGNELNLSGGIWDLTAKFNLNRAGFFIVGLFVITWVVALGVWRFGRVEARWEESAARARRHPQPEMEQV